MKKKILSLIGAGLLSLSLAGCSSVGLSVDKLMHPPKAVGDKAEIQTLIDSVAGEGYTLKYPQSGSYRSAITMKDIDSDSEEEAIAFYLPQGDIATVHMLVMDNIDEKWQSVGNFKSQSTAVESLNFCDLDGNGLLEIVTSWKTFTANVNQLSYCIYEENKTREVPCEYTASSLLWGDFTEENGDELMLLSLASTETQASATLLDLNENKSELTLTGTTELNADVASYASLQVGNVFENQVGAVIDGCTLTGEYTTQLLYFNSYFGSLERISFTDDVVYNQKLRSYPVMSEDVNNDSVIEVPSAFKHKIEKDRTDVAAAADLYWCQQTQSGTVLLIKRETASFAYGFTFEIPKSWDFEFTALTNHDTGEVTFYKWEKDKCSSPMLTFRIFDKEKAESTTGYTVLQETDTRIYTYITYEDTDLNLKESEIKNAFALM